MSIIYVLHHSLSFPLSYIQVSYSPYHKSRFLLIPFIVKYNVQFIVYTVHCVMYIV